jgi:branched-chain amino acid transport system permease protein
MLTAIVTGLAIGSLYAAIGIVFNLMFSTSKVLSITTGHIATLGAVFGAWFISSLGLPVWAGLGASMIIGCLFGLITEVVAIRRVLNRTQEHLWLLSTLALATIMQQGIGYWWGTEPRPFPRLFHQEFAHYADQKYLLPIAFVLILATAISAFYRWSIYGKIFIAVSEDPFAARARGISTDAVRLASFIAAGGIGALAGFAAGQLTFAFFAAGHTLTLFGFIGLAVGGLGSNLGAIVGGWALGVLLALTTYFIGSEYQHTIAVGLLIVILLIRPQGLFGMRTARPV